ncbi:hypothetical protein FS749_005034 [Ceratobasidium sp. UAMH 11750]|nr:hypothetical protein FS749_005034 [Ceratobasidium sp. UAMH 11750]
MASTSGPQLVDNEALVRSRDLCKSLLDSMHASNMTLDVFLHEVLYGNPLARDVGCFKKARSDLRESNLLPKILDNLHTPPRTASKGKRAPGAVAPLEHWAMDTCAALYRRELLDFVEDMKCEVDEILDDSKLKELTFQSILDSAEQRCPCFMDMLSSISQGTHQREGRQTHKDSTFCIVLFISALSYQISQRNNRTQMLVGVYLKAKGAPKSLFSLFQHCGMSMGYTWAQTTFDKVSSEAMRRAVEHFASGACLITYDNFRLPFKVKHQRSDHLSATDNGTTATLIPLPASATAVLNDPARFVDHRRRIKELYMKDSMQFLKPSDFHRPEDDTLINRRLRYNILAALMRIPEISALDLDVFSDPLLPPPPPIDLLPSGPEHVSEQFMLGTMDIDEVSLGGNDQVIKEILAQLNYSSPEKRKELSVSRMQVLGGDQLTAARGRGLQEIKQGDLNSYDRGDWIIMSSALFHVRMNLARAMYYESYGTSTGLLLARDVATLGWAGLKTPTKNRGPEFHTLDEALVLILAARYRLLWFWVAGVDSLEALVTWVKKATARQLCDAAAKIWSSRASDRALQTLDQQKAKSVTKVGKRKQTVAENEDPVLESSIRLQRDLMLYEELSRAIKFGDVGQINLLLPRLLMYFAGSGKWNYAREIAHFLQWQWYEAPPGFPEIIRRHCWLVNFNGQKDGFYPVDQRQELNNLALRLHGPPPQSTTWQKIKDMSPTIPALASIIEHFDRNFSDYHRSKKHYVWGGENDILNLLDKLQAAKVFDFEPSRTSSGANTNKNVMEEGQQEVLYSNFLPNFARDKRKIFKHTNTLELYEHIHTDIDEVVRKLESVYAPQSNSPDQASVGSGTGHVTPDQQPQPTTSFELEHTHRIPGGETIRSDDEAADKKSTSSLEQDDFGRQGVLEDNNDIDAIAEALFTLQIGIL